MAVIYFLLGLSVVMGAIFLVAFLWSLADGQYEDEYSPAWRILFDDRLPEPPTTSQEAANTTHKDTSDHTSD